MDTNDNTNHQTPNVNINLSNNTSVVSIKKKKVALLLCIFGGFLGLHQFYIGKTGKGILYMFTGGLFTLGWMFDIVQALTGSFRDANGHYLS